MVFIASFVSTLVGVGALLALLVFSQVTGILAPAVAGVYGASGLLFFLTALAGLAIGAALVSWLATLAVAVRVVRGPNHVGWVKPSECSHFKYWLSDGWRFYGHGGPQHGMRFLGLEVAVEGSL